MLGRLEKNVGASGKPAEAAAASAAEAVTAPTLEEGHCSPTASPAGQQPPAAPPGSAARSWRPGPAPRPVCAPQIIKQSILELRLQAEDSFVLKVVQLEELLQVRHSVFVIGNAGSGKSQARGPGGPSGPRPGRPRRPPDRKRVTSQEGN